MNNNDAKNTRVGVVLEEPVIDTIIDSCKRFSNMDNDDATAGAMNNNQTDDSRTGVVLEELDIDTIIDSCKRFRNRHQIKANIVRRFQHVAGFPSNSILSHSVNTNGVKDNPITQRDAGMTHEMLGPSRYVSQGKPNRTRPDRVDEHFQNIDVPKNIRKFYNNVVLASDAMCLNDVPFITIVSEDIHYGAVGKVYNLTFQSLDNSLMKVVRSHVVR